MTPLMVSETECSHQDGYLPCHGITISLCVVDSVSAVVLDQAYRIQPVTHSSYQLEVASWAVTPVMGEVIKTCLHTAISDNIDTATADYNQLAEYYHATHRMTDAEIESRTHGYYN